MHVNGDVFSDAHVVHLTLDLACLHLHVADHGLHLVVVLALVYEEAVVVALEAVSTHTFEPTQTGPPFDLGGVLLVEEELVDLSDLLERGVLDDIFLLLAIEDESESVVSALLLAGVVVLQEALQDQVLRLLLLVHTAAVLPQSQLEVLLAVVEVLASLDLRALVHKVLNLPQGLLLLNVYHLNVLLLLLQLPQSGVVAALARLEDEIVYLGWQFLYSAY